jgi:lipoyl synthase
VSSQPVIPPDAKPLRMLDPERKARAGMARPQYAGLRKGRKPSWLKTRLRHSENFKDLKELMGGLELNTVCEQARCPNIYECWEMREATFLIGGEDCTRRCGFCQIRTGKPDGLDRDEPRRVAEAVERLQLRFAVVTMVARDDLEDGGAWLMAETVRTIRGRVPGCGVEVLPSDFGYSHDDTSGLAGLDTMVAAGPDVFAFNIETCERLFPLIRPAFAYDASLAFLREARQRCPTSTAVKSNIIAGMGETNDEIVTVMRDLRAAGVDLLTIGQYLQPSSQHLQLDRYVTPEEFAEFRRLGEDELGFAHVESGPMVRSSYHAGQQAQDAGTWQPSAGQPGAPCG